MTIAQHITDLHATLPSDVQLVCVSKYQPISAIKEVYDAGQRIFGESRAQELLDKQRQLPTDIQWHFIGHLQTNKLRIVVPIASLIHSVDSINLLNEIEKEATRCDRHIDVLLQVHIAQEKQKYGFTPTQLIELIHAGQIIQQPHTSIRGLMGMATNTTDASLIQQEFHTLQQLAQQLRAEHFLSSDSLLSMGMSNDYKLAIAEGSNLIRIGSAIFEERTTNKNKTN